MQHTYFCLGLVAAIAIASDAMPALAQQSGQGSYKINKDHLQFADHHTARREIHIINTNPIVKDFRKGEDTEIYEIQVGPCPQGKQTRTVIKAGSQGTGLPSAGFGSNINPNANKNLNLPATTRPILGMPDTNPAKQATPQTLMQTAAKPLLIKKAWQQISTYAPNQTQGIFGHSATRDLLTESKVSGTIKSQAAKGH